MAGGFGAASLPLISAIALLAGTTLLVLGFAAPFWANDGTYYVGLWRYGKCSNPDHRDCYHYDQPSLQYIPNWLHVVRAVIYCIVVIVAIPLAILLDNAYRDFLKSRCPLARKDWLHVVRALECCAVILVAIPLVIIPVYMYIALGMYYRCMLGTLSVMVILSAIAGVVGVAIYGYNLNSNDWSVSWSLIVVVVGCACNFIGFLVLMVACCAKRPPSVREMSYFPSTIYVDPQKNKLYTIRLEEEDD